MVREGAMQAASGENNQLSYQDVMSMNKNNDQHARYPQRSDSGSYILLTKCHQVRLKSYSTGGTRTKYDPPQWLMRPHTAEENLPLLVP